ncbi:Aste57867_14569 [Aphanomyces stellatus]|uniref:Aste57867_14569 protein n=1 Tax=Aphanomyces stellatus TaxID=120398 RepID=A0A485L110_9STRA|nr:hypothetical protein As57867_014515 [Aphanomyces stellatus]VFT91389.1 Aste57867_14569 [Aphanomyces stellatus]
MLGEAISVVEITCALFSLVGVVCVCQPCFLFGMSLAQDDDNASSPYGPLGGNAAAIFTAMANVYMRKLASLHYVVVIFYFLLSSASLAGTWIVLFENGTFLLVDQPSVTSPVVLASAAARTGFLGQLCVTKGFQMEAIGIASVVRYLDVVFAFVWDAVWLDEPIHAASVAGAALIIACAAVIFVRKSCSHV